MINDLGEYQEIGTVEEFKAYKDAEEQGLLYMKVYVLEDFCHKPKDCEGDCEFCSGNELCIDSEYILYSEFDKTKHFKTREKAEAKLAEMQKGYDMEYRYPKPIQDQIDAIDKQILVLMEMKTDLMRNSVPRIILQKEELPQDVLERFLARMEGKV